MITRLLRYARFGWLGLSLLFLIGCNLPNSVSNDGLPYAWIDSPLTQSEFAPGMIQIIAHASGPNGLSGLEFSVDGAVLEERPIAAETGQLAIESFGWAAEVPGVHTLALRAKDGEVWGTRAEVQVIIQGELPTNTPQTEVLATITPTFETLLATATFTPEACTDQATFIGETIPDGTVFQSGVNFSKTWTLRNDGTCTWTMGYNVVFVGGAQLGAPNSLPLSQNVPPGGLITLSLNMSAPQPQGTYHGDWKLQNEEGVQFGLGQGGQTPFWVEIEVYNQPSPVPDSENPTVAVSHSPSSPNQEQQITISASARDNVGVTQIKIYFQRSGDPSQLVKTCNNTNTCSVDLGPMAYGNYTYYAQAMDAAGNTSTTAVVNLYIAPVIK